MQDLDWPFRANEALAAQLVNRYRLRRDYEAVHRNVYIPKGQQLTPLTRAVAAWLWAERRATLAGLSAAAAYRTKWIDAHLPAELNRRSRDKTAGIILHSDTLSDDEVWERDGMAVTSPARTAFDIGRRKGLQQAVIRIDALIQATGLRITDVHTIAERYPRARGIVQLRRALELADPGSQSPWESKTRLLIIASGLPRPRSQIPVHRDGCVFARLDLGWEEWLVGVEFDGAHHWTDPKQRAWDIDRTAGLEALGWRIIRVSADLLMNRPDVVIARILAALRAAGAPV
ncbi:DUF559 domain-containing protein [Mycobacterium sp. M26]|uniref:DUF559 domain-containing protein n=1 Tax=Mycobacterium sp. M26 TaxID=1762962 RepID=UPI00073F6B3F|nr:DUF559 domain-containing protein [Mycobacterium sp. M26]